MRVSAQKFSVRLIVSLTYCGIPHVSSSFSDQSIRDQGHNVKKTNTSRLLQNVYFFQSKDLILLALQGLKVYLEFSDHIPLVIVLFSYFTYFKNIFLLKK